MKRALVLGMLVLAAAWAAGCGPTAIGSGKTVTKWEKGDVADTMPAPSTGEYAIYGLTDTTAKKTVAVKAGDKLGFEKTDAGICAIAGDQKFGPYTDSKLYWKKIK